MVLGPRNTTST